MRREGGRGAGEAEAWGAGASHSPLASLLLGDKLFKERLSYPCYVSYCILNFCISSLCLINIIQFLYIRSYSYNNNNSSNDNNYNKIIGYYLVTSLRGKVWYCS